MEKARILIVEDESIVALDLERTLQRLGYQIVGRAATGADAVAAADTHRPDVVLMDIGLRGTMSGTEAAAEIRKRLDLPIIYLTSHADEHTVHAARATGPFGYV